MATNTYRQNVCTSLGLPADAPTEDIMAAFRKSVCPDEPAEASDQHASEDPREQMTAHALTEQRKAEAMGRGISFTEALGRARAAHPTLDQVLSEGYASGRWV